MIHINKRPTQEYLNSHSAAYILKMRKLSFSVSAGNSANTYSCNQTYIIK